MLRLCARPNRYRRRRPVGVFPLNYGTARSRNRRIAAVAAAGVSRWGLAWPAVSTGDNSGPPGRTRPLDIAGQGVGSGSDTARTRLLRL